MSHGVLMFLRSFKKKLWGKSFSWLFSHDDRWVSFKLNWTRAAPFGGGVTVKEFLSRHIRNSLSPHRVKPVAEPRKALRPG